MPTKDKRLLLILTFHQLQMLLLKPVLANQQLLLVLKILIHLTLTFHQKTLNTRKLQKNQRKEKLEQEKNYLRKKRGCGVIQVDLHAIAHC